MDDEQDPYATETLGENLHVDSSKIESNGLINKVTPLDIVETMRSLRVELQSCRAYNERFLRY